MSAVPEDVKVLATAAWDKIDPMTVYGEVIEEIARAIMADRAARPSVPPVPDAREEAIRQDERDRLYAKAWEGRFPFTDTQEVAANWLKADGAMLPAERQRLRAETEAR